MKYFFIIIFILLTTLISAETEQIVFYNSDKVLENNSELQEAQNTLENDIKMWEAEVEEIEVEIQKLTAEYEERKLTLLPSGKQEAEDRINDLKRTKNNKIEEIYGENGKIITRNNELIKPILDKLHIAIEKVAVENNYSIVLDAAVGAIGYAKSKLDITDLIIEEIEKTFETEEENK